MKIKNDKKQQDSISRSIPQLISAHLPGSVKPINDMFYRMDKITVGKDEETIKEIIYNDYLNNVYEWIMCFFKESQDLNQYPLSNFLNVKLNTLIEINKNFNFNSFQEIQGFQEKDIAVSEVIDSDSEENEYHSHTGYYFPFTWKCGNCNNLYFSRKKPKLLCKCNKKIWKQLNVALVNTSAKMFDLKSIKEHKDQKEGFLKCTECNAILKIIEKHNLSQYKLNCSKNSNHINLIEEKGYSLYSLYSGTLFHSLKGEIVNFNQQDLFFIKKATLVNEYINKNRIISSNDDEEIILEDFQDDFRKFKENDKNIKRKERLKDSVKNIELTPSFKKVINNLINTNQIISEEDLSKFYHSQIIERMDEDSIEMIPIEKSKLFDFEKIGILKDIQVINYTYGYSRVSDSPINTQTGIVKLRFFYRDGKTNQKSTTRNYFDFNKDQIKQIYFTQESNKGIYFKLNSEKLNELLKNKIDLRKSEDAIEKDLREKKFIYLHSLCHYLIRLISQNFSGISTSSLTELIFPDDDSFLIYKKGTGKELGYLEAFFDNCIRPDGERYEDFWEEVNNQNNLYCPGSEVCHGCCPECLIISKHSCKHKNTKLDRNLLLKG